mmetsp:Transcript_59088/g.80695  ORF Transcript_59088/g.80695 Transcript_59088/m.80695 type:complete len:183 (-) Transcript_59088:149-697(-)
MSSAKASEHVKGIALQWAGKGIVGDVGTTWPALPFIQSENECGNGQNTWDYAVYVFGLIHKYVSGGASAYTYWNAVLDGATNGSSYWGWQQNSLVSVLDGQSILNPEYFVLKHVSRFVTPGAVCLGTEGTWSGSSLAFQNPDGTIVVVACNPFTDTRPLTLLIGDDALHAKLSPMSFHTFLL